MVTLKLRRGSEILQSLILEPGKEYFGGRGEDCDIQILDNSISRKHFHILEDEGHWKIISMSQFGRIQYAGKDVNELFIDSDITVDIHPYQLTFEVRAEGKYDSNFEDSNTGTNEFDRSQSINFGTFSKKPDEDETGSQSVSTIESRLNHDDEDLTPNPDQDSSLLIDDHLSEYSEISSTQEDIEEPSFSVQNQKETPKIPAPFDYEHEDDDDFTTTSQKHSPTMDKTVVVGSQLNSSLVPFLRVTDPEGNERLEKIIGNSAKVGRSDACEVSILDPKMSRVHFEILKNKDEYFVRDHDSSNGTFINDNQLRPKQTASIRSGDLIRSGNSIFLFELRDPSYENLLSGVSSDLLPAVRKTNALRTKKSQKISESRTGIRFIFLIILAGLGYLLFSEPQPPKHENTSLSSKDPFMSLTDEQKLLIESSYNFGNTLYQRGNYDAAIREMQKVQQILPNYKNSQEIIRKSQIAIESRKQYQLFEENERKKRQLQIKVQKVIKECQTLSVRAKSVFEVQECLTPALELDPENPKIQEIITTVQQRIELNRSKNAREQMKRQRVKMNESLYFQAETLENSKNYFGALDIYKEHLNSNLPDPNNYKKRSKIAIKRIKGILSAQAGEKTREAKGALERKDFKSAITFAKKALEIDPKEKAALKTLNEATKELKKKLKEIYSDSVLEEDLGNVESAKTSWRKIVEMDVEDGEYFNKAKTKLKKYGE